MQAQNAYGYSDPSLTGNGAIILTVPDAPVSLLEDIALKSATSIALTWNEGPTNGGSAVIDY